MMKLRGTLPFALSYLLVFNSLGQYAVADSGHLSQDIKTLQASIDSGTVQPSDAVDVFSLSLVNNKTSLDEVEAYVKTQMTPVQFAAFQNHVSESLNGVDPSTLTAAETGDLVAHALSDLHKEGLYWSGCASVWTGAAVIAAAVIVGVIAIGKSKSVTAIQSDYEQQIADTKSQNAQDIANTTSDYNSQINFTNTWQSSIPDAVSSDRTGIANEQNDINDQQYKLGVAQQNFNDATTQVDKDYYTGQINDDLKRIRDDNDAINSDNNDIDHLLNTFALYSANPEQAVVDAQNLASSRDAAVLQLQQQLPMDIQNLQIKEGNDITNAPSNQALGKTLGIGAGIGAAIGAGLVIYGIAEGVSCGGN